MVWCNLQERTSRTFVFWWELQSKTPIFLKLIDVIYHPCGSFVAHIFQLNKNILNPWRTWPSTDTEWENDAIRPRPHYLVPLLQNAMREKPEKLDSKTKMDTKGYTYNDIMSHLNKVYQWKIHNTRIYIFEALLNFIELFRVWKKRVCFEVSICFSPVVVWNILFSF